MGLYRLIGGIVLGAALAVVGVSPASASSAPLRPSRGHLAFTGDGMVSVVDGDGSNRRIVYRHAGLVPSGPSETLGDARSATWSPDGKRLAFLGPDVAGVSQLFVVEAGGHGLRQVTTVPTEFVSGPSWSPDSKRITFSTVYAAGVPWGPWDGGGVLWTINRDGSEMKPVVGLPGYVLNPAWSPDGKQIAFSHQPTGNVSPSLVEVVSSAGGVPSILSLPTQISANQPVWSPNGTVVAYNGDGSLWFVRRDGTDRHELGCDAGCNPSLYRSVAWSPDGRWLAIPQTSNDSVTVVHPDGTSARSIRPVSDVDPHPYQSDTKLFSPTWSPDSRRLAFVQGRYELSASTDVIAVDLETGTGSLIAKVPSLSGYNSQIDWSRR